MSMINLEGPLLDYDPIEYTRRLVNLNNAKHGDLTGYDCPECLNRGYSMLFDEDNGRDVYVPCTCMKTRGALKNIAKSGLSQVLDSFTFDRYDAKAQWQVAMKDGAQKYADNALRGGDDWLFISGQSGCGKTHLCTAVCGAMLRAGIPVRYMLWMDDSMKIKASRFDEEAFYELLEPLKQVDVLYIDDLFKGASSKREDRNGYSKPVKPNPTDADIRLCYEIINARCMRNKKTIITCEWSILGDLMEVDEALFGRVFQKSKAFIFEIDRDHRKNYRLA